jgi:hypothetical protein
MLTYANVCGAWQGLTAADTGGGLSDMAYLSDFGKKAPSSKAVKGSALKITMPSGINTLSCLDS